MAKRTGRVSSTKAAAHAESLVDWTEPVRDGHVLDWRERAHEFGLVPVDGHGPMEPPVIDAPVGRAPSRIETPSSGRAARHVGFPAPTGSIPADAHSTAGRTYSEAN